MHRVIPAGTLYPDSILVSITPDGDFFALKTFSREAGGHGRFLISSQKFQAWVNGDPQERELFLDTDCGSFLSIRHCGAYLRCQATWLTACDSNICHGIIQNFDISMQAITGLLENGTPVRRLYHESGNSTQFITTRARRTLLQIQQDKLKKRALCKAMRDLLHWHGDTIRLYNDFADGSFCFDASCGIFGGLILHTDTVYTSHGNFTRYYYGVHT